jgi:hypothetical protein
LNLKIYIKLKEANFDNSRKNFNIEYVQYGIIRTSKNKWKRLKKTPTKM